MHPYRPSPSEKWTPQPWMRHGLASLIMSVPAVALALAAWRPAAAVKVVYGVVTGLAGLLVLVTALALLLRFVVAVTDGYAIVLAFLDRRVFKTSAPPHPADQEPDL
jgi:hypothetical protein